MPRPPRRPRRPWARRAGVAVCVLAVGAGVLAGSVGVADAVTVPAPPAASPAPAPAGTPPQQVAPSAPEAGASPSAPSPSAGATPAPSAGATPRPSDGVPAPDTGAGDVPPPPSAELAPTAPADPSEDPAAGQPTPAPNPQPGASPDPNAGGDGGWVSSLLSFGWLDIPGRILRAINGWFAGLVSAAVEPVVRLLGQTVLSTPDVTQQPRVRELWKGSLLIADSLMLLVLMAGGVAAMGYDSVQTRATAKEMLPRMILGFGAANLSLPLMSWAITAADALSRAFTDMGDLDSSGAFSVLLTVLAAGALADIFLVLLAIGVVGLMVMLIVGWIIRVAAMMALAVAGPLLLICHGLPWTEGAANLWWRALGGCLAVQVGQSILLTLGIRVLLATDDGASNPIPTSDTLANLLTSAAIFYLAVKLQSYATQHLMGGGKSTVLSLVKYRLLRQGARRLGIPL
ncbi:alanine and proline-rich secreted protein Apa [Frankia sp. R43]|uniref:alanine and proline-rich secreted protein Apa n=1 Tax=Frankia sp. R43 TaxID=269536 RepID=UPI001F1E91AB|nr:alanine and proline-rich secreted protein Apa [Frankia sp. R43]